MFQGTARISLRTSKPRVARSNRAGRTRNKYPSGPCGATVGGDLILKIAFGDFPVSDAYARFVSKMGVICGESKGGKFCIPLGPHSFHVKIQMMYGTVGLAGDELFVWQVGA